MAMARSVHGQVVSWRRDIHRHPELGFEETRTAGVIANHLDALGLRVRRGVAGTGVVATLDFGEPGATTVAGGSGARGSGSSAIGLRADMDALPINEASGKPFASEVPGICHACGHDGHVAMLLGAATALAELGRNSGAVNLGELAGSVTFIFQPAEEGPGGAAPMIAAGCLNDPPVQRILGLHLWPGLPVGTAGFGFGTVMAAADQFKLTIFGRGGHGAAPHEAIDAITVAAEVITALQQIASRGVDPTESVVLTIGTVNGGYRYNVIADRVEMTGSVRTLNPELRAALPGMIATVADGVARAFGGRAELEYTPLYPETTNDRAVTARMADLARQMLGRSAVVEMGRPSMGSEDFSFFLQKAPGSYLMVGVGNPARGIVNPIHHPAFDMDEDGLVVGTALEIAAALDFLQTRRISGNTAI